MKLSSIERWAVVLGVVLFLGGFASVLWPYAGIVPHETSIPIGGGGLRAWMQPMSRTGARVAGVLAMIAGVGIVTVVVRSKPR